MKTLKSKSKIFFSSILILSLVLLFGFGITQLAPIDTTDESDMYLVSNDIIKNFQFESFDGEPVSISGESFDRKLMFESQASWRINPDDISLISIYTQGDDVYIRYKVAMTSKFNMYTTVDLFQCAENNVLNKPTENFLVAHYRHSGLVGDHMFSWKAYLDWTYYDFGNIKQWNEQHNSFSGDLIMSFDIAQSPLPNFQTQSGDSLTKNFDYIAVSSIGVVDNKIGKLDDSAPEIVGISPREYDEDKSILGALDPFGTSKKFDAYYDPDIELIIHPDPLNSFDAGINPQSSGSSMNPRTKSGDPIWNPEATQESMPDCKFIYNIGSLSPLVTEYYGTLSYRYIYYETIDYWKTLFTIGVKERVNTQYDLTYTKPVALHVTNRYIQTEVRVVFDMFTSYNIDVGADGIEDFNLEFPSEYYDLLLWLTTVDGFGGGVQHTSEYGGILGLDNTFTWIIIIAVIAGGVFIFIYVINPILKARRQRRMIETALRRGK